MTTNIHSINLPKNVQIGWGYHVDFCVWKDRPLLLAKGVVPLKPIWHNFLCPVICDSSVAVQNRKLPNAMRTTPQFHGIDGAFSFQVLCGIPIVAPYHILLSKGPTCRHSDESHSWLWQCVARNASDPPVTVQHEAPLIHKHTTFKGYIAFSTIITAWDMPLYILFTITYIFNALCLIICLSEHRTFAFRLALYAYWSVTN